MMKKNILITGGAGFVGSNLACFLEQTCADYNVICFDNLVRPGSELNVARLKDAGINFIKGDIRFKDQLFDLPKIDILIECSAEPSVLAGFEDPQYTIDTNLIGTLHCLELARRDGSSFIFLSTSRVYPIEALNSIPFESTATRFDWPTNVEGIGLSFDGISEEFPLLGVRSLYGATKLSSENVALEYFNMFDLKGVINRFGIIAGPWQMGKVDQGLVGFWTAQHFYQKDLKYIGYEGKGQQVRDAVHVDDVCHLILHQMENLDQINGQIFNVGGGRRVHFSLCELTDQVQAITKKKIHIEPVLKERKADVRIYVTDYSLLQQETGWTPKKNLEEIIEDVHQWLQQNEDTLTKVFNE